MTGTAGGIAFSLYIARRSNNIQAIAVTTRNVVIADWLFTAPALVIVLISGLLLMKVSDYSFTSLWFTSVIALFGFITVCWIPVVYVQYKLRALAEQCVEADELLDEFKRLFRWWIALGIPGFVAVIDMFWIMVFKPFVMD